MLYRLPQVSLTVFTRSGRTYGGRLLTAAARGGFLLSPHRESPVFLRLGIDELAA
jgi:hypothetical protein